MAITLTVLADLIRLPAALQAQSEPSRTAYRKALTVHGNHKDAHRDAAYQAAKRQLPAFIPSGQFSYRDNDHLTQYSGLLSFDLDGLDEDELARIKSVAKSDPYCVLAYVSPSGYGIKIFIRWSDPRHTGHKPAWDAGMRHVEATYGVTVSDRAGRDLSRCSLLAHDPAVYFNPDAKSLLVPAEPERQPPADSAPELECETEEEARIWSALKHLDPDASYEDWIKVGMALRQWNAERGFVFWDAWSARGSKYRKDTMRGKWESFAGDHKGPVTLGTLFHMALERGWTWQGTSDDNQADSDDWPDLIDVDAIPLPAFPMDGYPVAFRDICNAVAETSQVPVELPAGLALAVAATCSARAYDVMVGNTHVEPTNLYCVVLMDTCERKSSVFKELRKPVDLVEAATADGQKAQIAEAASQRKTREARLAVLRRKAATARPPELVKYEREIRDMEAALPVVPAHCQLTCSDVTPEYLARLMYVQGGRIAQFDPECGSLVNILNGQYSKDGASTCDIYLKAYSGDPVRVGRVSREMVDLDAPALTLALTGQPAHLRQIKNIGMLRDRGLLGRILWLIPPSRVGSRVYKDMGIDDRIRTAYRQGVQAMFCGTQNPPKPLMIQGEALAVWSAYYDQTEKALAAGGPLHGIRDWAGRRAGHVARIAGNLHLMTGGNNDRIAPETIASAVGMVEAFTQHTRRVYRFIDSSPQTVLGSIVEWIRNHGEPIFGSNDLYKGLRSWRDAGALHSNADLRPYLEDLVRRHYIRAVVHERTGAGRPAAGSFQVSPRVLAFSGNSGGSI